MDARSVDERYLHDWSGTRYGTPVGLERPADTAELAQVLRHCHATRTPVAVQGGRTGVSGGAAPGDGELVLALERMNRIESFDREAGVIVAGAGTVLEDLQRLVEAEGWSFPLDLGSRGSCQIGGNVATNAGGARVLKYGPMRALVLGVEAVLADGAVLGAPHTLVKHNAGYALGALLVGSEGTLGVVSRVALRLVPLPPVRRTALLALAASAPLAAVLGAVTRQLGEALSAFEVMWPDFVAGASAAQPGLRPLPASFDGLRVVLVEVEGRDEQLLGDALEAALMRGIDDGLLVDVVMSTSQGDAQDLWALREGIGELQAGIRPYVGFDLGVPTAVHDRFVAAAKEALQQQLPQLRSFFFGHAGDSNLHAVIGPCREPGVREQVEAVLHALLPAGSAVTAEHGIGRKKKPYLGLSRSATDIEAMKAIKRALDPLHLLNPGRIFDR